MNIINRTIAILLVLIVFSTLTRGIVTVDNCTALFPITLDKKMGYIDCNGKIVVQPIAFDASYFKDGVGYISNRKGDTGIVTLSGELIYFTPFELLSDFSENLALAKTPENKFAFISKDKAIKFFLPSNVLFAEGAPIVSAFKEGIATVKLDNGSILFIDKDGKTLFERDFEEVDSFSGGISTVEFGSKGAVIDRKGNFILKPRIVNRQAGKIIFAPRDGIVRVQEGARNWKYIDNKGKILLNASFDYCGDFIDGLAVVSRNNKFGFINKKGKIVIPLEYSEADDFSDGLAFVKKNKTNYFINSKGKLEFPLKFGVVISPFNSGLAYFRSNIEEGYIDKSGNWVWKKKVE